MVGLVLKSNGDALQSGAAHPRVLASSRLANKRALEDWSGFPVRVTRSVGNVSAGRLDRTSIGSVVAYGSSFRLVSRCWAYKTGEAAQPPRMYATRDVTASYGLGKTLLAPQAGGRMRLTPAPLAGRGPGRPTRHTLQMQNALIAHIEAGLYLVTACQLEGLDASTATRWLARGAAEDARCNEGLTAAQRREGGHPSSAREEPFRAFRVAVLGARARAEARMVTVIQQVAAGGFVLERKTINHRDGRVETVERTQAPDGKLALEYLSRTSPQRWGRSQRIEVAPTGSSSPGHQAQDLATGEELKASLDAFYAARGEQPPAPCRPGSYDHGITDEWSDDLEDDSFGNERGLSRSEERT